MRQRRHPVTSSLKEYTNAYTSSDTRRGPASIQQTRRTTPQPSSCTYSASVLTHQTERGNPAQIEWNAEKANVLWEVIALSRTSDNGGTDCTSSFNPLVAFSSNTVHREGPRGPSRSTPALPPVSRTSSVRGGPSWTAGHPRRPADPRVRRNLLPRCSIYTRYPNPSLRRHDTRHPFCSSFVRQDPS